MLPVYNWQDPSLSPYTPPAPAVANTRAPNMLAILRHLLDNFGGNNLGILNVRPQTAGTRWSTHAFGAALDWGFIDYTTGKPNQVMRLAVIDFLIAHHEALGVQMIIDEGFNRTWKSYRADQNGPGWKVGTGVWGSWLHIETTLTMWANSTPVADRLTPPPPITPPPTMEDNDMLSLDWNPGKPNWTAFTFTGTHLAHTVNGHADGVLRNAGVKRVIVNDAELLGLIQSTETTSAPPSTLTPAMLAAWSV